MQLNEEIQGESFRLVGEDGLSKIVSRKEMFSIAAEKNLDVMLVSGGVHPPVVKLVNYEEFVREEEKTAYQITKKTKTKSAKKIKSIIVKLKIDNHDLEWKIKKTKQWLLAGEKVQLLIKAPFDISETRMDIAYNLFNRFRALIKQEGKALDKLKPISKTQYACIFTPESTPKKTSSN